MEIISGLPREKLFILQVADLLTNFVSGEGGRVEQIKTVLKFVDSWKPFENCCSEFEFGDIGS